VTFDPSRIFETLDRHQVDYLTIGAWAVIAHGYVRATADIYFVARLDERNMERSAAALSELKARLRGVDADELGIDPTDPQVLMSGVSFTMDTDVGPLDFLNDVPGAADYDDRAASKTFWTSASCVTDTHHRNEVKISSEPPRGFEPRTYALRVRCSTPELRRRAHKERE
jgi:hypothetical protein